MNFIRNRTTALTLTALSAITILGTTWAPGASAQEHVQQLKVTGKILPAACSPSFGGAEGPGVVDYGNIERSSFKAGEYTKLPEKKITFDISCNGPARLAVSVVDNRAATKVMGLAPQIGATATENAMYGLGANMADTTQPGARKFGAFHLSMDPTTLRGDTRQATVLNSSDSGTSWTRSAANQVLTGIWLGWTSRTSSTAPEPFEALGGTLNVIAVLNKPEELPTGTEITLDGMATFEVKYL